ncbi:MAG: PD40 domain-containing protein [Bacteroidia bacterium]|nr:PD40 domain-containing protein [Bacteroidia bacterium]
MKLNTLINYTLAVSLLASTAIAQTRTIKKGTKYYNNYSYSKAIKKLEPLTEKSTEVNRKLADSYMRLGNVEKAESYYATVANAPDATPADAYNYFYVLRSVGKYTESETWIKKFHSNIATDSRGIEYTNNIGSFTKLKTDEGRFKIKNLEMNSAQQEFGATYYNKQIVYASTQRVVQSQVRTWNGNDKNFLNMYVADRATDNELLKSVEFSKSINKKYHEGPASFSTDGKFMVFTRDNYENKSSDGVKKLQLFSSELKEDKWTKPEAFTFNNKEYSTGHPSLTADGKTMYFASDMPGGKGGADLYKTTRGTDGVWTAPENLGTKINTEGNEIFPSIHKDGLLFFASNGHVGLGGLDVFVAQLKDGKAIKLQNVGTPINGTKDDFAFILDDDQKGGYFSSNRTDGKGDDDIYSYSLFKPFKFGKQIKGVAKDKTGTLLANTKVNLYDGKGKVVETIVTSADGAYLFNVDDDDVYKLDGVKDKYFEGKNTADTKDKDVIEADVILEKDPGNALCLLVTEGKTGAPVEGVKVKVTDLKTGEIFIQYVTTTTGIELKALIGKKLNDQLTYKIELVKEGYFPKVVTFNHTIIKPGVVNVHELMSGSLSMDKEVKDLRDLVVINDIRFDVNKFNIRPDAAIELDKVVEVMNKYAGMEVELGAHTDCRAPIKYNETLSDKRAKASAAYIKAKISNPLRIYGKGYGESVLLNDCACEGKVKFTCTEEEHQKNRRTEFKIISMGSGADKVDVINNSTNSFDKKLEVKKKK